ncbi:shikimate kinase [Chlamydiifrater volucris]|uniref:shikimate kinase n=1 Tax=Chlamydiifrater volucris TaxID=2681470 RepID=UPI001BD099E3|nr:shikimate kinase [Chlamydiifrater volucris]
MLVICGLPRSGKTSLGKQLSEELHVPFVDLDLYCRNTYLHIYKKPFSCSQIVRTHGERFFRELESFCLTLIHQHYRPSVISLGGGTLLHPKSTSLAKKLGVIIHLEIPFDKYLSVSNKQKMPETLNKLSCKELIIKLKFRNLIFKKLSNLSIAYNHDQTPEKNSQKLIRKLKSLGIIPIKNPEKEKVTI